MHVIGPHTPRGKAMTFSVEMTRRFNDASGYFRTAQGTATVPGIEQRLNSRGEQLPQPILLGVGQAALGVTNFGQ